MKMNQKLPFRKLMRLIPAILLFVFLSIGSMLSAQSFLKAQVRSTNCPVSQHQADLWFFGQNAGIDFRDDVAVPFASNNVLNVYQSSAIICDSMGNLLFFTDGMTVWDRIQQAMPNGTGLHGDAGVTQPAIIIPKPGDDSRYYIFTVDRPQLWAGDTTVYGLQYSEIDLTLNGGRGDVVADHKNVPLIPEVSEKVTATYASNGTDIWVVSHRWDSDQFVSFLVTTDSVTMNFVTSSVGSVHVGPISTNNSLGYMKISPDGSKLALAIQGKKLYEIFNFDNSTGKVSSAITSPSVYSGAYGIAFSPDTRFLYTSTAFVGGSPDSVSRLYQFDISQGANIFNSPVELAVDTDASYFAGLQLATDGRIYVARSPYGRDAVGVIYNPKRPGLACNFNSLNNGTSAFDLNGKLSRFGFPNFIQNYFDVPHFDVENICFSDTTMLKLTNDANIDGVSWDFGDPASSNNTSTDFVPTHTFSAPGQYNVSITESFNGVDYTYNEDIVVNELPLVNLGDTVYMYPGSPILLNAGEGFTSYEWSTGENSSSIIVGQPGMYYVTVQNEKCCFNTDSVRVVFFDVLVPNAFRPGGVNSVFKAVPTSNQAINDFSMFIYNRWGQQIFTSNDIGEGWDGTVKGTEAPGDVYVWLISYNVQREGGMEKITYKGNVVLLR
jgi:gliding motility-associated-like protein